MRPFKYSSLKNTTADHWTHQDWARPWSLVSWISYWGSEIEASLVAQMVKNLPAVWETQDRSLSWEDPLEKGMLPTPVFLPGESQGQRSLVGYSPWTLKESDTTERLTLSLSLWGKIESGHCREWRVLERKGRKLEEGRLKDCLSQWCSSFSTYHNHFEDLVKQKARFCS